MKIFNRYLILLAVALLTLEGCSLNYYKQLQLKSYDIASVTGFNYAKASVSAEVVLDLGVVNPTKSSFTLVSLDATLYKEDGKAFAHATALEPAYILPQSDTLVPLRLDAILYNPMVLMLSHDIDLETMTADIDALVKSGKLSKRIKEEKYPLKKLAGKLKGKADNTETK
ncbi:MAG: hypothetical protein IKX03_01060 [Bacteroidales bacterium]|nr:hypothetical protein [Bacteroidales bacterium]